MTTEEIYFFDTYALIEILKDSPSYQKYTSARIITSKLNLYELFYYLTKTNNPLAEKLLQDYNNIVIDYGIDAIAFAVNFKLANNSRNISIADSIGYAIAKLSGVKFLTGDKEFENMGNVEFVK
ncbi:MAG TPA: PIN domain-containing protein [Candidatus Nanoarchaeia archaeon]|nr:PIN domain-containing protein [Candidatus Nanoarchaeia archaeon]